MGLEIKAPRGWQTDAGQVNRHATAAELPVTRAEGPHHPGARTTRIIVRPLGKGYWAAETETGETLVARSRAPFLDGARALLALGADAAEPVTMAHAKRPELECFLPVALGIAARLTVEEGERSARLRNWSNPAERLRRVGAGSVLSALPPSDGVCPLPAGEGSE